MEKSYPCETCKCYTCYAYSQNKCPKGDGCGVCRYYDNYLTECKDYLSYQDTINNA